MARRAVLRVRWEPWLGGRPNDRADVAGGVARVLEAGRRRPTAWEAAAAAALDNVPMAMLTLFECSTTEGWIDVMFAAIDTNALDMQPVRGSQPQWALFFIFFMLFGGYFVVNLFVGVLLSNFKEKKNQKVDEEKTQREWQRLVEGLVAVVGNEVTEKAKQIFEVLDEDGSGGLDADELRTGLRKLGQKNVTRAEADAMIAELDHDGNGAIDIDEFLTIVHDLSQDMEGNWLEEWLPRVRAEAIGLRARRCARVRLGRRDEPPVREHDPLVRRREHHSGGLAALRPARLVHAGVAARQLCFRDDLQRGGAPQALCASRRPILA